MDPTIIDLLFSIAVLIMSVIAHELAHGYAAEMLGDPTARLAGRLTLNPLKHLDPVGSVLVPSLSYFLGGFIFGWAKPVPYNPYNLRKGNLGEAIVASAGILTNIGLAVIFALVIRIFGADLSAAFIDLASLVVMVNIVLAIFNLVPIPPLDGSKILFSVLPFRYHQHLAFLEQYGFVLVLFFIFFLWEFFVPIAYVIFNLLVGMPA